MTKTVGLVFSQKIQPKMYQSRLLYFLYVILKEKSVIVVPFHVNDVFRFGKPDKLKYIKENIKNKFNISEFGKVKNFLGVYYK